MATKPVEKNRIRRAQEQGTVFHSWNEDRFRIALVYPNTYSQGMSNLGFQTVYHLINKRDDCHCERFFLPDKEDIAEHKRTGTPLLSIESERQFKEFDLIALSVSFENDYLNLPLIFELSAIPFFSIERKNLYPLVLLGGVCAFINPEPLADIVDLVAVGEAEPILPPLLDALIQSAASRTDLLARLLELPGVYVPQFYTPDYSDSGQFVGLNHELSVPARILRLYAPDLDTAPSRSFIQTEDTEFGNMALTEVSRGCSRGCRFCAAGYVYLPPRQRSLDNLLEQVDVGLNQRDRIGLVAAAVADYSQIDELQQGILARNGKISMSSLRLDALTVSEVENLKKADHKTVSIAPEAGSQRLRDYINKGISEEQILSATQLLAAGGIKNIKLYFIIGFPDEREEDIAAILDLVTKISALWRDAGRQQGSLGTITLSVNPFIPKPFTPLQWTGMAGEKSLKQKYRRLQSAIAQIPNTRMINESIRFARLQTFLSRGDRRIGQLLPQLAEGKNLKHLCREVGLDLEYFVTAERDEHELFPWEVIDQGVDRDYLWREYQKAQQGEATVPCAPGCRRCGVCGE
ncbi:MAG: radical SAM protein [Deltaproteobacteria bacterium]|nr:radical SAM protein [Deltaproteobacteria bacterium]